MDADYDADGDGDFEDDEEEPEEEQEQEEEEEEEEEDEEAYHGALHGEARRRELSAAAVRGAIEEEDAGDAAGEELPPLPSAAPRPPPLRKPKPTHYRMGAAAAAAAGGGRGRGAAGGLVGRGRGRGRSSGGLPQHPLAPYERRKHLEAQASRHGREAARRGHTGAALGTSAPDVLRGGGGGLLDASDGDPGPSQRGGRGRGRGAAAGRGRKGGGGGDDAGSATAALWLGDLEIRKAHSGDLVSAFPGLSLPLNPVFLFLLVGALG